MKARLKNLSPNNLPLNFWFETDRACHFSRNDIMTQFPEGDKRPFEALYLIGGNKILRNKTKKEIWVLCTFSEELKRKEFIEITKQEAIAWLIEERYLQVLDELNGTLEPALEELIEQYSPGEQIPPMRRWSMAQPKMPKESENPSGFQEGASSELLGQPKNFHDL